MLLPINSFLFFFNLFIILIIIIFRKYFIGILIRIIRNKINYDYWNTQSNYQIYFMIGNIVESFKKSSLDSFHKTYHINITPLKKLTNINNKLIN
jgi:hypothetical protein